MNYKVFRVIAERRTTKWDLDNIPYEDYETYFEDTYSSKVNAIRMAQKLFSKQQCNVRVVKILITDKGTSVVGVVYRKYLNK